MDGTRWRQIEAVFADAIELPVTQRSAFLARLCARDAALHEELLSLLQAHDAGQNPLDTPPGVSGDKAARTTILSEGTRLGAWQLGTLLGSGGAGEVYLARRADGAFEQQVALKLLRREAASQVERFNAERQILARLDHPGIARLLDGGLSQDGRPYAVVEFVAGVPLIEHCRTRATSLDERLALFAQVCEAVAYAHRNLIVHRDLKSGNILVTPDGRVKLLDFGIAKQLDAGTWPKDDRTSAPFTPDYAAPEQLTGDLVTTATDVYALGVLLCELLTDLRPWASAGMPFARTVQLIVHDAAPAASRIARGNPHPPVAPRLLQGDLDAIVAKCLRKEPAHRYATVDALRTDLERHQQHAPVLARERARLYVIGRLLRRHRFAVLGGLVIFVSLTAGLAMAIWQADQARQQSQRAEIQAHLARAEANKAAFVKDFLLDIFNTNNRQQADPLKAQNTTALQLLDRAAQRLTSMPVTDPVTNDDLLNTVGSLYGDMGAIDTSVKLRKRRLDLARGSFPRDDPRVVDALLQFGGALYDAEGWKTAIVPLSEADALLKGRGDLTSLDRARLDVLLAEYWRSTDIKQALFFAHRAVASYRDHYPNNPDYAGALHGAGLAEGDVLNHRTAERMYALAVLTQERLAVPDSTRIQDIVMLAESQRNLMMSTEAEKNYRKGIEISERINGPDHIDTLQAQLRYGAFLRAVARYRESINLLRSAERHAIRTLGEQESFHVPTIRADLAKALFQWGDPEAAIQVLNRAVAVREKTRPNTKQHGNMLLALGQQLITVGRFAEADAALTRCETIFRQVGLPILTSPLPIYRSQSLLAQGRVGESLAIVDAAETFAREARAKDPAAWHDKLLAQALRVQRARALLANADYHGAELLLSQLRLEAVTDDEAAFFTSIANERALLLGQLYTRTRRSNMAVPILQAALAWRKANLAAKSPLVLEANVALAEAFATDGRAADARQMLGEADAIARQHARLGRQYSASLIRVRALLASR